MLQLFKLLSYFAMFRILGFLINFGVDEICFSDLVFIVILLIWLLSNQSFSNFYNMLMPSGIMMQFSKFRDQWGCNKKRKKKEETNKDVTSVEPCCACPVKWWEKTISIGISMQHLYPMWWLMIVIWNPQLQGWGWNTCKSWLRKHIISTPTRSYAE